MLLYDAHLDYCDGDNQDYNFELVTGDLDEDKYHGSGSGLTADGSLGGGGGDGGGDLGALGGSAGDSNKINIMNVIKTENSLDELLLDDAVDDDPMLMQHVEYLDD